jgi:hypothetical protein
MTWKRVLILAVLVVGAMATLWLTWKRPPPAQAEPAIYASPVHAGCYLVKNDRCKIHVEPFAINLASGQKLVRFQLVTTRAGTGAQTVIYDFRPDQSNPVPTSGSTFTPTLVAKDFAATCGLSYTLSLQGMDTGDAGLLYLGTTHPFTCPKGAYRQYLPIVVKS